ncbi:MAG: hypothetical protein R6V27_04170 [Balneolaceae bacterium]
MSILLFAVINSYLYPGTATAQEVSGSLKNYNAFQIYDDHELLAGRNRLNLNLRKSTSFGGIVARIGIIDSYRSGGRSEILPTELYVDWFTGNYDIRIGKQEIIWGESNGSFVNDILTPVDLREFLTRDMEDLRTGLTALNIQRYFGANSIQLVVAPTIQPDRLPEIDSRWFPLPVIQTPVPFSFIGYEKSSGLNDIQGALRFAWRPALSLDVDLMLYHWAHPMPAYAIQPSFFSIPNFDFPEVRLTESYKTTPMAGYSVNWQPGDRFVFSAEGLFAHERLFTFLPVAVNRLEDALDDPVEALQVLQEFEIRDDGYLLTKPWLQQMLGVQTDFKGATLGLQAAIEIILNYEDRLLPQQYFPNLTFFGQRSFLRDRLQAAVISRYNIFGEDYWLQLMGTYEIADGFETSLGTNLFGGPSISPFYGHLSFEQFQSNSFLFGQVSVYF